MQILDNIIIFAFVVFCIFLILGFNNEVRQRSKIREEKAKKYKGEKMKKTILVPLARGFEEAEFIGIVDVLRRASENGGEIEIIIASLDDELLVCGANKICIKAETSLKNVDLNALDAIALAGGFEGMMNLKNNKTILEIIKNLHTQNKLVAAICASPIVLNEAGVLSGEFTCYPSCEQGLNGTRVNKAVHKNKNVLTGAGPAVAILFGLELVRELTKNEELVNSLYNGMLVPLSKA